MAKKKYYVVWSGRQTGIFDNWNACDKSVNGFKGAEYKSFNTLELAEKAYSKTYSDYKGKNISAPTLTKARLKQIGQPILDSISVDAACSGNPGIMEYQGVNTKTKETIFKMGPFKDSSNNIGEFLALAHALAHMKKNNDNRPIYSDSKNAIAWIRDIDARVNIKRSDKNQKSFELIERAINWLKNNKYKNKILKWETKAWGEIPADFGRK